MARNRGRDAGPGRGRALKRLHTDTHFWGKLAALWHRERVRDEYVAAGYTPPQARQLANQEALEIARSHGWRGDVGELKAQLADLLDPKAPILERRGPGGPTYWEEAVRTDLRRMLASDPDVLRREMAAYLRSEVDTGGRFAGQIGLYKLSYIIGYIPPMEYLDRRNAFLQALSEVGHDPELCERDLFKVVFRVFRPYTLKPFEARVGFSMPATSTHPRLSSGPGASARPPRKRRRGLFGRLRPE